MDEDFETFSRPTKYSKKRGDRSDLISMSMDLLSKVNFKVAIFLFLLSILIFSDSFVDIFLSDIPGAVDTTEVPTTKGTIIQLLFLTFGYMVIDLLATGEII